MAKESWMSCTITLTITSGKYQGTMLTFPEPCTWLVGHTPECDLCVTDVAAPESGSGWFALLRIAPPHVWVCNLEREQQVRAKYLPPPAEQPGQPTALPALFKHGDVLQIGPLEFAVQVQGEPALAAPAATVAADHAEKNVMAS